MDAYTATPEHQTNINQQEAIRNTATGVCVSRATSTNKRGSKREGCPSCSAPSLHSSQHGHRRPQLQRSEDNVQELFSRTRMEQDQGRRIRNRETTKSKPSAREVKVNKDPQKSLSPISRYFANPSRVRTCIQQQLQHCLHMKQTTKNKSRRTSFISLPLHHRDKPRWRINISDLKRKQELRNSVSSSHYHYLL